MRHFNVVCKVICTKGDAVGLCVIFTPNSFLSALTTQLSFSVFVAFLWLVIQSVAFYHILNMQT